MIVYLRQDTDTGEVTCQAGPPGTEHVVTVDPVVFAEWIESLDAEEVQAAAFAGRGMGGFDPTQAILDHLVNLLKGEST